MANPKIVASISLLVFFAHALAHQVALAIENSAARYTIKDVMYTAYKEKLANKVIQGEATPDERRQLLTLYEALAKAPPPRGTRASWQKKTGAMVLAAQAAVEGQANAPQLLKKTMDCGACHTSHK